MRATTPCALLAALALGAAFLGCDASTAGRRVPLRFRFVALAEQGAPLGDFQTETGWQVSLTAARVAIGPVYAMRAPVHAGRGHPRRTERARSVLAALLSPPRARAHGGHGTDDDFAVLAQVLEQHALDLLDPTPRELAPSIGTAGHAATLTLLLEPPSSALAEALHGHHAYVEGVATKDALVVPFAGGVDLADTGTLRRVENVTLDAELDADSVITLGLRPARWLAQAHFDRLGPADDAGVHPIASGDQVHGAFSLGLRSQSAYEATHEAESP